MATYTCPTSIASDGSRGVVTDLNDWLASLPDGSTALLRSGGTYLQGNQSLRLDDRTGVTLDGQGATLLADKDWAGTTRSHILIRGGSDCQVRNLTIQGRCPFTGPYTAAYNSPDEWQRGIHIRGHAGQPGRPTVLNCTILNVFGDAVEVGPDDRAPVLVGCRDITISGGTFRGQGRHSVSVTHADRVLIENVRASQANWSLFDLETDAPEQFVRNVTIRGCITGAHRHHLLACLGASVDVSNLHLFDTVMESASPNCTQPVFVEGPATAERRSGFLVRRNTFLCYQAAGLFTRVDHLDWCDNTASSKAGNGGCGRDYHVGLTDVRDAYVARNTFSNVSVAVRTVA